MYRIRPYSADAMVVEPTKIMYHLPNYHQEKASSTKLNGNFDQQQQNNDSSSKELQRVDKEVPPIDIQQSQTTAAAATTGMDKVTEQQLIDRLRALSSHLDAFISKHSQKDPKLAQEKVTEAKPTSNSPDVLYASLGPTSCAIFPVHDYGNIFRKQYLSQQLKLSIRDVDRALITLLRELGGKRDLVYIDENGNYSPSDNGKVIVKLCHNAKELHLVSEQQEIAGEIAVWKFLGTLLGLYSAEDMPVSTLTDQWLTLAASTEINKLSRALSAHLGATEFLSSQHAICLADVVLRSFYSNLQTGELTKWTDVKASNNVQLWIKRVDEALGNH